MARQLIQSNPALTRGFESTSTYSGGVAAGSDAMTLNGTIEKTIVSLIVLVAAGAVGWRFGFNALSVAGMVAGLGIAILLAFRPQLAPKLTLVYSVVVGFGVGGLSALYNSQYDNIVLTALGLTIAIASSLLFLYRTRIIRPSRNFILAVTAATLGIALFYVVNLVVSLFGGSLPLISSNSNWGILFTLFVVCLAAANLVVDFDFIERGAKSGHPKYMEWYGAFGLMVTLVWLYVELLRLISKLQSRD